MTEELHGLLRRPDALAALCLLVLRTGLPDTLNGEWIRTDPAEHAEQATARSYRGAVSLEEIFVHQQTGQQIVRHTIVNEGRALHETFRTTAKFGLQ